MLKPAAHQVAGHAAEGKVQRKQKMSLNRMLFFPPVYVKITKNICFFLQPFGFIAWIFVFVKVPETKGMPLEVIVEFFAMSAAEKKKAVVVYKEEEEVEV